MTFFPINTVIILVITFFSFFQVHNPSYSFFPSPLISSETIPTIKNLLNKSSSSCLFHSCSFVVILIGKMGFSYLLNTNVDIESFKTWLNIPCDVNISYCHEGDIEDQRLHHVVFFPLMSIPEGEVRFLVNPLLCRTLSFYRLSPNQ